ncbi:LPXTG cell wall anchor domain-containing protein [Dehalobacter sp. DCM]|nr:LPXTG cell wall anchor domain-containing protein [Dehalobacter sp. DCM]
MPTEDDVFVPETEELPKTGGNTVAYLLTGSVIAGAGALLRKFQK